MPGRIQKYDPATGWVPRATRRKTTARPIVLAGHPREAKFRVAGGGSRADATPTNVGTRKLYE